MNILVLTPDSVGSTILQRIITLALFLKGEDVQNCHELTNGIALHDHHVQKDWDLGFIQSLEQISQILIQSKSSLVSRLAKYIIDERKDLPQSQNEFYRFLNEYNDNIIMCTRKNIFEYALSWAIRHQTNVLNVYTPQDRQQVQTINKVDLKFFHYKCEEYVNYVYWVHDNFPNVIRVDYEDFVTSPETVIDPICHTQNIFAEHFGSTLNKIFKHEYHLHKKQMDKIDSDLFLPVLKYKNTMMSLGSKGVLPVGTVAPIKNTSLTDKQQLVGNFNKCKKVFQQFAKKHNWIDTTSIDYDFWNQNELDAVSTSTS